MPKKYLSIFLLTLVVTSCGGGSDVTPEEIEVTLNASSETVQYNDTYTLTWSSNASQCYASGGWSGEKPISGSETFTSKTNGPIGYGLECRKNNVFVQAQTVITLEKDFNNSFDFSDDDITELLSIEQTNNLRHKVSSHHIGDFNNDGSQDILIAYRVDIPQTNAEDMHPRFFQILGGAEIIASEIIIDGCTSGEMFTAADFNLDGIQDLVSLPTKTVKTISGQAVDSNMCFFEGSDSGLDITNWNSSDYIDNSTSINLNNLAITSSDPVDISGDGSIDLLLWANEGNDSTAGLPFYIISNTATNAYVQLSTDFIDLDPYLPSNGCAQGIDFLCSWPTFFGTSQIYFNSDSEIDLIGSACEKRDDGPSSLMGFNVSSMLALGYQNCSYTNFTERYEEGNDFNWSVSDSDVLTSSLGTDSSWSRKIVVFENNLDGLFDLILLEGNQKFSVYERLADGMSAQDSGDFQFLLNTGTSFTDDWILLDLDLDNDFDLLAPLDCYYLSCSDKFFSAFQKSSYDSDRATNAGDITFAATPDSPVIIVTDEAHNAIGRGLVTFNGAESLGGSITAEILNGQFTITSIPSEDTYTIETSVVASADDLGNGGSATVGTYVDTTYIWTDETPSISVIFSNNTVNTLWLDSDGDNDIDVISITESIVTETDTATYKIYHHKNDSLR